MPIDKNKKDDRQLSTSETICENDRELSTSAVAAHNTKKDDKQLSTSLVTCDNMGQDDKRLPTLGASCDVTKQEDRQLPISHITCDNTKTVEPITESIGEPSAIVTSRGLRNKSQKRIALKRRRRKWSGLKTKRVTFAVRKGVKNRKVSEIGLTSKQLETEECDSSEGRYENALSGYRPEICPAMFIAKFKF